MRFLGSRTHGIIDYLTGLLLIAAPWLFDFAAGGAETWIPVALGSMVLAYSLFTDYELSISRSIPLSTHLMLDMVSGIFLAISPWLFGFADYVSAPHLVIGLASFLVAAISRPVPDTMRSARDFAL